MTRMLYMFHAKKGFIFKQMMGYCRAWCTWEWGRSSVGCADTLAEKNLKIKNDKKHAPSFILKQHQIPKPVHYIKRTSVGGRQRLERAGVQEASSHSQLATTTY